MTKVVLIWLLLFTFGKELATTNSEPGLAMRPVITENLSVWII